MKVDKIIVRRDRPADVNDEYTVEVYAHDQHPLFTLSGGSVVFQNGNLTLPEGGEAHINPSGSKWDIDTTHFPDDDGKVIKINRPDPQVSAVPVEQI